MTTLWEAARAYLGTPWLDSGRSKKGIDCLGLVLCAGRDIGLDMDPGREFNRRTSPLLLRRAINRHANMVTLAMAAPGDIMLLDMGDMPQVGILSPGQPLNLIYALAGQAVVETSFRAGRLPIRGIFRL